MEALLLNEKFESISIIDNYKSFIWTDRYNEAGDFEIYIRMDSELPKKIKKGYYLWCCKSEHIMVVESLGINTDDDEGNYFVITGRSLESILDRRIVWNRKSFTATVNGTAVTKPNLQNGIKTLLEENVIGTSSSSFIEVRKIPNFIFKESTDEKITNLTFEAQYYGENLYEVISKLCIENDIGFKITLNDNKQFVFELYAGVDRSYAQTEAVNPYVIFSPDFDNIFNTGYIDSDASLKNVTLVAGESEKDENDNITYQAIYVLGFESGLNRREIFTDAGNVSTEDDGETISAERYQALLRQKGIDTLIENTSVTAFEGEIDASQMFIYGKDYFIGDIVQIADEYGQEGQAYISEFIISSDSSGESTYPTFKTIQKGVYEE